MASSAYFLLVVSLALVACQANASDPSPLQDFCVADNHSPVKVNGFVCKDPMAVNADDFFKAANLDKPMDTMHSKVGSVVTLVSALQLPGLNTLGISLARIDYAPLGQNPPHTHPRATEILTVLEGRGGSKGGAAGAAAPPASSNFHWRRKQKEEERAAAPPARRRRRRKGNSAPLGTQSWIRHCLKGLSTLGLSPPTQTTRSKVLNKGDVFVFPQGLIHFQFNPIHDKPAVALVALSSQNPGVITIANAVFGSKPPISDDVLAKAFQVEKGTIDWLQAQFWENNQP